MAKRSKTKTNKPIKRPLIRADWIFFNPSNYKSKPTEKGVLFRYELAREVVRFLDVVESSSERDAVASRWGPEIGMMKTIFAPYFPERPYLDIDEAERRARWRAAFLHKNGNIPVADDPYSFGYSFRSVNGYKDTEHVDELIATGAIPECPSPCEGGDYPYLWEEEHREAIYDAWLVSVDLDMDLRFEDAFLVERFKLMLNSLRDRGKVHADGPQRKAEAEYFFSGGRKLDAGLKWLAISRLWDACGDFKGIQTFLTDQEVSAPGGNSIMYTCTKRIRQWINNPPVVPRDKMSIRDEALPKPATGPSSSPPRARTTRRTSTSSPPPGAQRPAFRGTGLAKKKPKV